MMRPAALIAAAILSGSGPALAQAPADRQALFGETHIHTGWSFDAYVFGTKTTPEDAYRYALGETIEHAAGYPVHIGRPLDFMAVTDHAEYVGTLSMANTPGSAISKLPVAQQLIVRSKEDIGRIYMMLAKTIGENKPIKELISPEVMSDVWKQIVAAADKYYKPGKFTTFAAFEWSSTPDSRNLHRNIIFRDSKRVPQVPFSAIDSTNPEDLWTWMDAQRKAGNSVLAISHNGNLSDGAMFPTEVDNKNRPIDEAWARQRMTNEPLTEVVQLKGSSETHPELSPNDEFASFEILTYLLGDPAGRTPKVHGSYIREAYLNGLKMQASRGFNPYKFGMVGASDSHNSAISYTAKNWFGGHGLTDATPQIRMSGQKTAGLDPRLVTPGGLAGVWADANTREGIYDAMARKECYGTSGVRIRVRMFGGWRFGSGDIGRQDWVKVGYEQGVPMGSDLPAKAGAAPTFLLWAVKDPDDANLDRIQVVKGWVKGGQTFEKIYDVAWSGDRRPDAKTGKVPPVHSTVDLKTATYTNAAGSVELKTFWRDPDFDPSAHAFYYARVMQIPTPRWTTYEAVKLGMPLPSNVPATVQDRAWTSPIWYAPTGRAAALGGRGRHAG